MPTNVCLPLLKSHLVFERNVIVSGVNDRMSEWAREREIQANHSGWICAMILPVLFSTFTFVRFFSLMHLALRTTSRSRHKYRPEILSGKMVYCPLCPNIVHLYHSNINEYSSVACLLVVHTPTGTVKYDVLSFFTAKKIRNRKHVIKYGWLHLFGRKLADSNFYFAWEHRANYCAPFLWIWFVNIA